MRQCSSEAVCLCLIRSKSRAAVRKAEGAAIEVQGLQGRPSLKNVHQPLKASPETPSKVDL